ncbi:MAG: hypothetical protein DRQ65_09560 [Gammaproteobacteria bacterium]|nr:MAG: hypothetical protein DRQ65_09560 [Gammaproteobacteria bacterium]
MGKQLEFKHLFSDESEYGMLSLDLTAHAPASVQITVDKNSNIHIAANRDGWLHIARVAAELGLANFESGHHLHVDFAFNRNFDNKPEMTLEVAE